MALQIPTTDLVERTLRATAPNRRRKPASARHAVKRMPAPVFAKVRYRNEKEVNEFLATQPQLPQFLQAAWPILAKHFGKEIEVVLELIPYPYAVAQDELVGWVQFAGTIQDGLAKLDKFVDEWFLEHMEETNHRFNFNVEIR